MSAANISQKRLRELKEAEGKIGYRFRDPKWLDRALTHTSFLHDSKTRFSRRDYQGLEFLGDSILGFVVAEYLFTNNPDESEGKLSKIRSFIVSSKQLYPISKSLDLGRFIRLGRGEELTGGREKEAILADLFESVIGAIYLDGGLDSARAFILRQLSDRLEKIQSQEVDFKDYKSPLQEKLQGLGLPEPHYRVIQESGPDHRKVYTVEVKSQGKALAQGMGRSKKAAEQEAAKEALRKARRSEDQP